MTGARSTHTKLRPIELQRTIERHLASNETVYTLFSDAGELEGASRARVEAIDLEVGYTLHQRYRIEEHDPLSARVRMQQKTLLRRGDWKIQIETDVRQWATLEAFRLQAELDAYERGCGYFLEAGTRACLGISSDSFPNLQP